MKTKHYNLYFSSMLISVLLLSITWLYLQSQNEVLSNLSLSSKNISATPYVITIPEKQLKSIAENIFIEKTTDSTAYKSTNLSVLGYAPVEKKSFVSGSKKTTEQSKLYSDNKFYREGDYLEKSVLVKSIQKKRVLIEQFGKEKWYQVTNGLLEKKGNYNESFALSAR